MSTTAERPAVPSTRATWFNSTRSAHLLLSRWHLPGLRFGVLLCAWFALYGPYIVTGGLVRDDLGFVLASRGPVRAMGWLDQPREFGTYPEFQLFVSSFPTMTGRPVSALVTGAAYWLLGTTPWPYHLMNLGALLVSMALFYAALAAILSPNIAFVAAILALAYPTASATAFSFIMVNSNLAGVLWAAALYLDATSPAVSSRRGEVLVAVLLLCSALSYETFIPLFAGNVLVRLAKQWHRPAPLTAAWAVHAAAPSLAALLLLAAYRGIGERLLFAGSQSAITAADGPRLAFRLVRAEILGVRETFARSIDISLRSVTNLDLLPPWQLGLLAVVVAAVACAVYTCVSRGNQRWSGWHEHPRWLKVLGLAVALYLLSNTVFILSEYIPNSSGFESRTQGAVRLAAAFVLAVAAQLAYDRLRRPRLRQLVALSTAALCVLFAASTIGQREAWSAAARENAILLGGIDAAIRRANLNEQPSFTLVADLPPTFAHQVNAEPVFGGAWDLGPAVSLLYPASNIRANVYEPIGTIVKPDEVVLHGYWVVRYPLYFYRFGDERIYRVNGENEFEQLIQRPRPE